MSLNVQQIMDYVLPKVQEGKQDEAKQLIEKHTGTSSNNPLSGLKIGSLDLGNIDLATIIPQLSKLIKPEYLEEVKDYLGKMFAKK